MQRLFCGDRASSSPSAASSNPPATCPFSTFRLLEACTVLGDSKRRRLNRRSTSTRTSLSRSQSSSIDEWEDDKADQSIDREELRSPDPSPSLDAATSFQQGVSSLQLEERLAALAGHAVQNESELQGIFAADDASEPSSPPRHPRLPVDDADRMRRLIAEFGAGPDPDEEETFVAEAQGLCIAEVLIKGRLFLTNQRLFFYALLPNLEEDAGKDNVLKAAVVEMKRSEQYLSGNLPGIGERMRFYGVLTRDTLSIYRSATDLLSPIGVLNLNDIVDVPEIEPGSDRMSFTFIRRGAGGKTWLETHSAYGQYEEAVSWQRELSHAIWAFRNRRDRYRVSIPFDRVRSADRSDYLNFTTICTIEVDTDKGETRTIRLGVPPSELAFWDRFDETLNHCRERRDAGRPLSQRARVDTVSPAAPAEVPAPLLRQATDSTDLGGNPDDSHAAKIARRIGRLCEAFNISPSVIRYVYHAELSRLLYSASGVLGIGDNGIYFFARRPTADVKVRVLMSDVREAQKASSIRFSTYGLRLLVRGHEDINFDFHDSRKRDRAIDEITAIIEYKAPAASPPLASPTSVKEVPYGRLGVPSRPSITTSGQQMDEWLVSSPVTPLEVPPYHATTMPRAVNFEVGDVLPHKMRPCCMTIGSRGDVQPYIALCQRMMLGGIRPIIATHPEYKAWVESFGIEHRSIGGDPGLLMQVSVEHKIFSLDTVKKFSKWFEDLHKECYAATEGVDCIIESPSTFAGIHVAEARKIPYFRAFTMPFTRTKAFPHAFMSGPTDTNGSFNYASYLLYEQIIWKASGGMVNKFRKSIGLPATDLEHMRQREVPFVYNFSTAVVPRPMDWPSHVVISGYWFLQTDMSKWSPPADLVAFIAEHRKPSKPIVYIGFGSITVPNAAELTKSIIEAVELAGVACVLAKGWSDRMAARTSGDSEEPKMPKSVYQLSAVPHDWLFDQIDAAMHHGGAGTTAASLRAGLPTLIKPFFGDQYFWARTVTNNGVCQPSHTARASLKSSRAGMRVHSLSAKDIAEALMRATTDRIMKEKAQQIGEKLRAEDGVGRAVKFFAQWYRRAAELRGAEVPARMTGELQSKSPPTSSPATSTPPKASPSTLPATTSDLSKDSHRRQGSFSLQRLKLH